MLPIGFNEEMRKKSKSRNIQKMPLEYQKASLEAFLIVLFEIVRRCIW